MAQPKTPDIEIVVRCDPKLENHFISPNDYVAQSYLDLSEIALEAAIHEISPSAEGKFSFLLTSQADTKLGNPALGYAQSMDDDSTDEEVTYDLPITLSAAPLQLLAKLTEQSTDTDFYETLDVVNESLQVNAIKAVSRAVSAVNPALIKRQEHFVQRQLGILMGKYALNVVGLTTILSVADAEHYNVGALTAGGFVSAVMYARLAIRQHDSMIANASPIEALAIEDAEVATSLDPICSVKLGPGDYFQRKQLGDRAY